MTPGRCCRVVRAAMFAAVCVLLAATGHILMSGAAVPWWAMAAAFGGTAGAGWALAGRERGLLAVTGAAVGVQAALHAGFSLVQSAVHPAVSAGTSLTQQCAVYLTCGSGTAAGPSPSAAARVMAGPAAGPVFPAARHVTGGAEAHAHHAHHAAPMTDTAAAVPTASAPGGHDMLGMSPAGMLTAHLVAAVLAGLWLAYGERAVFRLLRALAGRLRAPLRLLLATAPVPRRPRLRVRRARRVRAPRRLFLVHAITSRGPPTAPAVL